MTGRFRKRLRQLHRDVQKVELQRAMIDILSEMVPSPKLVSYEIRGRIISGKIRTQGEVVPFKMDYTKDPPEFTVY